jgi:hypothetical protein
MDRLAQFALPWFHAGFYDVAASGDGHALVVGLSRQELNFGQRKLGRRLRGADPLARILGLHRTAVIDELAGRAKAADLGFDEATRLAITLWSRPNILREAMASALATSGPPESFASEVLKKVLIGASLGFSLGADDGDARGERHLARVEQLAAYLASEDDAKAPLIDAARTRRVEQLLAMDRLGAAAELALDHFETRSPDEAWAVWTGELLFADMVHSLKPGASEAQAAKNAGVCQAALLKMEKVRRRLPTAVELYNQLGEGFRILAVQEANAGRWADAVRAAATAALYEPTSAEAVKLAGEIKERIATLGAQIAAAEAQIRSSPNKRLSNSAEMLKSELGRARAALAEPITDNTLTDAPTRRKEAVAHRLWRMSGLAARPTAHSAEALLNVAEALTGSKPAELKAAVELAVQSPDLTGLAPGRILACLTGFWAHGLDPADSVQTGALRLRQLTGGPPIEMPAPLPAERERVVDWLFSARDRSLKRVWAAAAAILAAVGLLWSYNAIVRAVRAHDYAEILTAAAAHDPGRVSRAANAFLAVPLIGNDVRVDDVRRILTAATDLQRGRPARDRALGTFEAAQRAGDLNSSLTAAESFFANLPATVDDARTAQFADVYRRTFNTWLLEHAGAASPDHLAAFQKISALLNPTDAGDKK